MPIKRVSVVPILSVLFALPASQAFASGQNNCSVAEIVLNAQEIIAEVDGFNHQTRAQERAYSHLQSALRPFTGSRPAPDLDNPEDVELTDTAQMIIDAASTGQHNRGKLCRATQMTNRALSWLEDNQTSTQNPPVPTYAVGDVGPRGGIVISTSNGGISGFEVAIEDAVVMSGASVGQPTVDWGCANTDVMEITNIATGFTVTDIGSQGDANGESNTDAIVINCDSSLNFTSGMTAADVASNFSGWSDGMGGGSLPNLEELFLIHEYDQEFGVLELTLGGYWSSSEVDATMAWTIRPESGPFVAPFSKSQTFAVRAISYF